MKEDTKQAVGELAEAVGEAAEQVVRHRYVRRLVRLGFYSKGLLFIVIGAIALAVIAGARGAHITDQRGALATIAGEPFGRILLIVFVVGAAGHGLWNIFRAVVDIDGLGRSWFAFLKRFIAALTGVFYLGLGLAAAEIIVAAKVDATSSQAEETFVGVLLALPVIGAMWAMIIGLGLIGAGVSEGYSGVTGRFRETYNRWRMATGNIIVVRLLGFVSYPVRAVLMIVMGVFFVKAPFAGHLGPIGLDAALLTLLSTAYGNVAVAIAGVGLVAHGVLAFYEARYRKLW